MSDMGILDPYEEAGKLQKQGPPGKKLVYRGNAEGFVGVYEDKHEPSRLSGRHKKAVRECPDEAIRLAAKMFSYDYYQLGQKITVRHDRGYGYVCLTCIGSPNCYETKDKQGGCAHISRIKLFVEIDGTKGAV